jgi:hypothetical protein
MSFAVITLGVASQLVFVVVDFVMDSVRKLLDTLSCLLCVHIILFYSVLLEVCMERDIPVRNSEN